MKLADILNFKKDTALAIREGRLHEALDAMRSFSEGSLTWEITTAIDSMAANYQAMLTYFASGIDDPGQKEVYDGLVAQALSLVDNLTRRASVNESATLYYNVVRTLSVCQNESIASLVKDYGREQRRLAGDIESIADPRRTERAEAILRELFNRVWVTYPLSSGDVEALRLLIMSDDRDRIPVHARALAVSAVSLGLLEFYDIRRFELLFAVYLSDEDDTVRLRALTGALAAMYRYRTRPVPREVSRAFDAARIHPDFNADFAAIAAEMMRTVDTDRITESLNNKMKESFRNFDPELRKKLQSGDFDMESIMEGNPEWEESLAGSGLADTFKEIQKLHEDGSDVFMASFSNMKQFPFFTDLANWFMPFHTTYSSVAEVDTVEGTLSAVLAAMPGLCDSDKFSIMLAFRAMPTANRESFIGMLEAHSRQLLEALSEADKSSPSLHRRSIIGNYVQSLYRFYRLFRRKGDFFPLLSLTPNLLEVKSIEAKIDDVATLEAIAEFYFSHKFWPQAAHAFSRLDALAAPDAARSQKLGYSLDMSGRIDEAISKYEEAEMLDEHSVWTLRRLAAALRRAGQYGRAVTYYKRLSELCPDDGQIALNYGYALSEDGRFADAEAQFYKAAYLMPDSYKPMRGLAWTQFLNHKLSSAIETYRKIFVGGNADDSLNYGHALLASGNVKDAISVYRSYSDNYGRDIARALREDARYLEQAGVDTSRIPLIIEAVKYGM